jgi:transposase
MGMEHHVGIDVSLELSSLCVLDAAGRVVREAKVASEPEALVGFLRGLGLAIARVGLEAGPLSQWLHDGLREAGYDVVLLETRHVKAALSAMAVKTDRRDARGIAQLLRMGGAGSRFRWRSQWNSQRRVVPPRASQVGALAGDPGAAGRAQAAAGQGG